MCFLPENVPPFGYLFPVTRTGPACHPGNALSRISRARASVYLVPLGFWELSSLGAAVVSAPGSVFLLELKGPWDYLTLCSS